MRLKSEHAQKMLELSQDVLHTKKDFEEKLRQFEAWKMVREGKRNEPIERQKSRVSLSNTKCLLLEIIRSMLMLEVVSRKPGLGVEKRGSVKQRSADITKKTVTAVQRLQEAEDRYENRDSRPEDLELIDQLRERVREKEERVHALIEEKKFFQMELVNRETNFNKVFSCKSKVGVLNPLDAK
ncbi:protein FAM184B-like, partial [Ruditapes philippinarum]|uniref:protein FAM184B-like n=1 Tax=Ruditapes philippinarum TaxID=129788 RepID=UPI00295B117D